MSALPEDSPEEAKYIKTELGELNEIESRCPRCESNGVTRLMITDIPHFKEIIVSSFECPHCGEKNNEVTFGGVFGPKKKRYELKVNNKKDLDRQVVKSEFATLSIPELQLEIPPESQKGSLTTVEGVLSTTKDGLSALQPVRQIQEPQVYEKIESFCRKLDDLREGNIPFTVVLDDPAGNSYIEGRYDYYHPTIDPQLVMYETERTDIDRQLLGLEIEYDTKRSAEEERQIDDAHFDDVSALPCACPACTKSGELRVHQCDIPYFKETVIMAFRCDFCGYRSNEIKSGGEISEKALRLTLRVDDESDLKRDVLKSDTATLRIPEISLELAAGTLGGFFSTVEGTLAQVRDQLQNLPQAAFVTGDSAEEGSKTLLSVVDDINNLIALKTPFTFILEDPLANTYIQNPRAHLPPPENDDPKLFREEYLRTYEEDEELGLHDINTEPQEEK
eukprot:gene11122-7748_t